MQHLRAVPHHDTAAGGDAGLVRVDLHVHSCHSARPYSYFLRSGKAAECYTRPSTVHDFATRRGMDLVTLCDHDEIAGALELCERADNAFVSEEVSARFPEDGCIMHVIALGIDEAQHAELQRLRRNVYELVAYMAQAGIAHFLCHPLSSVNRRLEVSHIRKALLMFGALEIRNGTRDELHERELRDVIGGINTAVLASWASDYPEVPWVTRDARYAVVGGSDDHGGLAIARAFTAFRGERSIAGLRAALAARTTEACGYHGSAATLSHNVYGVLGGYLRDTGQIPLRTGPIGPQLVELAVQAVSPPPPVPGARRGLLAPIATPLFMAAAREGVTFSTLCERGQTDEVQERLTRVVDGSLLMTGRRVLGELADAANDRSMARTVDAVPDVLRWALLSLPYILGTRYQGADRATARTMAQQLGFSRARGDDPSVAVITDTIDDVNGVALGLRRLATAAQRANLPLHLVGAGVGEEVTRDRDGIVRMPPLLRRILDLYPEMTWAIPHLPALMRWLCDERIDIVQCATPGPMGLAGLAAARLLSLPVVAQYHTELPEYATQLSGDPVVGDIVGTVVAWFYRQADLCLAPSRAVSERLEQMGVARSKIARIPRGIDLSLFHPDRRDESLLARWGLTGKRVVLYVGRLSKEKNLDALVGAFRLVRATRPDVALVLVGNGPYAPALLEASDGFDIIHTGVLRDEALAAMYASADVFAFPSETETFGNAVVEAQAAGLPVVVASRGAAHENVQHGVSGLVVEGQAGELATAIATLLDDAPLRARLGRAAHRIAQRYDLDLAARAGFELYRQLVATPSPSDRDISALSG